MSRAGGLLNFLGLAPFLEVCPSLPLSAPFCTFLRLRLGFLLAFRALIAKNPRKLRWKSPTYGPLIRPYRPYKEVNVAKLDSQKTE